MAGLTIKRRKGQGFRIGSGDDAVWVYVHPVQEHGKQISLKIVAGRNVPITREEHVAINGEPVGPHFDPWRYKETRGRFSGGGSSWIGADHSSKEPAQAESPREDSDEVPPKLP